MTPKQFPNLQAERVRLVPLFNARPSAIIAYFERNKAHLAPTDPPHPDGFFTESFWAEKIDKAKLEYEADSAVRFVIQEKDDPIEVVGTLSFTQIARGPFQACYLGYAIDQSLQGRGLMTEAAREAIQFMFSEFNIHRIMANYMPENKSSARVLEKLDFIIEGRAKDYLFINGAWRDHVLTSLTNYS